MVILGESKLYTNIQLSVLKIFLIQYSLGYLYRPDEYNMTPAHCVNAQ
jgi:hypothetical protein